MRITLLYNFRTAGTEERTGLLTQEDLDRMTTALVELRHQVAAVEASGNPNEVVNKVVETAPDLIFNLAEGTAGKVRRSFYPGLFEQLGLPFTGGGASLFHLSADRHLTKTLVASRGIQVPRGVLATKESRKVPPDLRFPLVLRPNSEELGITLDAIVDNKDQCAKRLGELLEQYPQGIMVEEFIHGRELSVPFLEAFPTKYLEVVEYVFDASMGKYNIFDSNTKKKGEQPEGVTIRCPADLTEIEKKAVIQLFTKVFSVVKCPDFGRVDIRLHQDGTPYFIKLKPMPSLNPLHSMIRGAAVHGLEFRDVLRLIIRSATRRQLIKARVPGKVRLEEDELSSGRPTARELGIVVGRFQPGFYNAITDVKGVKVGHVTHIFDGVEIPGVEGPTCIRTGVTAVLPVPGSVFEKRVVAGGFVLNGVGEVSGLTQIFEWGWMETPILLTNTMSVGRIHSGVISYMTRRHPQLGTTADVVIPVVGETDDSWLNDVRVGMNSPSDAIRAAESAKGGPVQQGSIGAGTGMMTCDFAGGIGTSSRVLMLEDGGYTIGVLVLSNFGNMRNLTVDGYVVGRELDKVVASQRRSESYGSIIVVIATDAPLMPSQLNRISRRAALGLGRVGSHAASGSGEIIIAFSTANRLPRTQGASGKFLNIKFISDQYINPLYEAVIEATEEAILNAIFCSKGMRGRENREAPALPHDMIVDILRRGREVQSPT